MKFKRFPSIGLNILLLLVGAGCRPGSRDPLPEPPPLTFATVDTEFGERALQQVADFIALGPRVAGTPGAEQAAIALKAALEGMGLETVLDAFIDETPDGPLPFRNVLAHLPGQADEPRVLLVSHFDTMSGIAPDFVGANDSGSSTGFLLELARSVLSTAPVPFPITLAFVDGEECRYRYGPIDGLHGSRRLAQTLAADPDQRPHAVIVLDMIGARDVRITVPPNSSRGLTLLTLDAADALGLRRHFGVTRIPILDDHQPFLDRGIPAVLWIDFTYGSAPGLNDYWHTPEDTLDKLCAQSLQAVGQVLVEMLNRLRPGVPDDP